MEIYHGNKEIVQFPEIRIQKYTKDFSWGFYCTENYNQAVKRAKRGTKMIRHLRISFPLSPPTKMTANRIMVMSSVVDRSGSARIRNKGTAHNPASLARVLNSLKSSMCSWIYIATKIIMIIFENSEGCNLVNPRLSHRLDPFTPTPANLTISSIRMLIPYNTLLNPQIKL